MWEVLVLLYRNEKNPYTLCWLAYATRKNVIGVDNNPYVHSLLIGLCEEKERDWCRQQSICSLFVDWLRWKEKERVISFSEWGRNLIGLESNSPVCRPSFRMQFSCVVLYAVPQILSGVLWFQLFLNETNFNTNIKTELFTCVLFYFIIWTNKPYEKKDHSTVKTGKRFQSFRPVE